MSAPSKPIAIQASIISISQQNIADISYTVKSDEGASEAMTLTAAAETLMVCRAALVKSPAASRFALTKHRASIDPTVAKALEMVGSYTNGNAIRHFMKP